jgi:hypothetical protein
MFKDFSDVQFYDYTKIAKRFDHELPKNYHLTFSYAENTKDNAAAIVGKGHNVAIVFRRKRNESLPKTFWGKRVIDGDLHDLRFTDSKNVIVGLHSKGKSYKDKTGFVVD